MPDPITAFQELFARVPEVLQPLVVVLAGAVPYVEGEGSTVIGVLGGLHPVLAGTAAILGNLLCVVVVVLLGSRIRAAVVARSRRPHKPKAPSKGHQRSRRLFLRFGVPGVSLLGPIALPTQFTSAALVASGVAKGRVIVWQVIAITVWTVAFTVLATGVLSVTR